MTIHMTEEFIHNINNTIGKRHDIEFEFEFEFNITDIICTVWIKDPKTCIGIYLRSMDTVDFIMLLQKIAKNFKK